MVKISFFRILKVSAWWGDMSHASLRARRAQRALTPLGKARITSRLVIILRACYRCRIHIAKCEGHAKKSDRFGQETGKSKKRTKKAREQCRGHHVMIARSKTPSFIAYKYKATTQVQRLNNLKSHC